MSNRPWISRESAIGRNACMYQPQWLQALLFSGTSDADICKCAFPLSSQLVAMVHLEADVPVEFREELHLVDSLAANRDDIVNDVLQLSLGVGKKCYLKPSMGKKEAVRGPMAQQTATLIKQVETLGRLMRWIAISYFSADELQILRSDHQVRWVEAIAHANRSIYFIYRICHCQ